MKYLILISLLFAGTSCSFKKIKKNEDQTIAKSTDMDELEKLELEEEEKEKSIEQQAPQKQQPLTRRQRGQMSIIDTNRDGKISYKEYMLSKKSLFKRLDVNSDGFLTIEELKARRYKARIDRMKKRH
jgi:hypothetical protein